MTARGLLARLARDERGATVVEFAFAFPALIVLIYCIAQLGMVYRAVSGIQHSLGEGARVATVFKVPDVTAAEVRTKMEDAVYGIGPGTFTIVDPQRGQTTAGIKFLLLKVNYKQATTLLLFPGPDIQVERTKRVYLAEQGGAAVCSVASGADFCLAT